MATALEMAKRSPAVKQLEAKIEEARQALFTADSDMREATDHSDKFRSVVEQDQRLLSDTQLELKGLQHRISELKDWLDHYASMKDRATFDQHQRDYAEAQLKLPVAQNKLEGVRARLSKDQAQMAEYNTKRGAAQQKLADSRATIIDLQRQMGDAIQAVLAKAASLEKWDDADYYASLELCREKFADRIAREIEPDKVKSAANNLADSPPPPPPPSGTCSGIVGCIDQRVTKPINPPR